MIEMFQYIARNPDVVRELLAQHLALVGITLAIALAIAFPVALLVNRYRWLAVPVLGVLGILYTVPSLALIILLIPLFGLTRTSVVIALVVYAQIVLVRNILAGLSGVNPALVEAARGMGMSAWQTWRRVQLPLALPVILAGVRIAAVVTIGIATVGAYFGVGGFGVLLFEGITTRRYDKIYAGALLVSVLAFAANGLLLALERAADTSRRVRKTPRAEARAAVRESANMAQG